MPHVPIIFRLHKQAIHSRPIISSLPLTRVATLGKPHAIASRSALGMPSQREEVLPNCPVELGRYHSVNP